MVASSGQSSLGKIPVCLHFADLFRVLGAVRRSRQQPLVAIPGAEERMRESASAKLACEQQPDTLLPALHELLQGFGSGPAAGRAGVRRSFALPGPLGYLIEDEFIHFAAVALWWWRESFVH